MPNNDCIRRSDAIFALCKKCEMTGACDYTGDLCNDVKSIEAIPAADVKPVKRGRWVNDPDGVPCCSECGECAMQRLHLHLNNKSFDAPFVLTVFCPSCGADMLSEPYEPPKSWTDNPWCNAVDKAMEPEPPKEEDQ